jgi:hypothetical protein
MTRNEVLKSVYGSHLWSSIKSDFIKDAKRVKTMAQMSEFAQKWSLYVYFETTLNTLKGRVTELRNTLKNESVRVEIMDMFLLPTAIYTEINTRQTEKVKEVLLGSEKSDINYISLFDDLTNQMISDISNKEVSTNSNNSSMTRELAYKKLIVVALATGRRQIEIMKTLSITKKKENALYDGLVKKKSPEFASVVAPILVDISIIKKYLKDIREEFKTEEMTNKEINSKFNASIGKALLRILPEDMENKQFHFFRSIYAEVCFEKFGNGADKNIYFGEILGHEDGLNPAHSYQAKIKKG